MAISSSIRSGPSFYHVGHPRLQSLAEQLYATNFLQSTCLKIDTEKDFDPYTCLHFNFVSFLYQLLNCRREEQKPLHSTPRPAAAFTFTTSSLLTCLKICP